MSDTRSPNTIPVEEIVKFPRPGTAIPRNFAFSPDDSLLTYLYGPNNSLTLQLFAYDHSNGETFQLVELAEGTGAEKDLSLEEELRRERVRERSIGITTYKWGSRTARLVIPLQGDIYLQDGRGAAYRKIVDGQSKPALNPKLSPDGRWVAYVQDAEVYVISAESGEPRQITQGARGTGRTNGLAEFIAQEEMKRGSGYWWSPDSQSIAFVEVDETHIPVYRIMHQGKDQVGKSAQEDHRYPFAGAENAKVRLGVVSIEGGEVVMLDLGEEEDIYLARVKWFRDGSLTAQIQNREQTQLDLIRFDIKTGAGSLLLRETNSIWINLHDMLHPLKKTGGFIWASERSGFRHLYLYNEMGEVVRQLTTGNWMVTELSGVDEENGVIYFTATKESHLERHLYAVDLEGGEPRKITRAAGSHMVVIDHGCKRFVDIHSALDAAFTVTLRSLEDGSSLFPLHAVNDPRIEMLGLQPPELITLKNREGTTLQGAVYKPFEGEGPFPTLVYVYGGPGEQLVANKWDMSIYMRVQFFRSAGFLVFILDNRGSFGRGLEFEGVLKHSMGQPEVDDQVDGVRWLIEQGLADPERVGISGWSYGGYMSALCLSRAPEIFKVAVAGAPVSAMDGYDTHYTERYMGTPQSNPEGYAAGSVLRHVKNMEGKLLIIHGLIDENVHFRHSARLINALIEHDKPYDLLLFPSERHMPRKPADLIYMEKRVRDYLLKNLV